MARQRDSLREQSELFWAWLAGFIDGDGCIGLYGTYDAPLVSISQKERHILDVIVEKLGTGSVCVREERGNRKIHGISFGSGASQEICRRILPYLVTIEKIRRAEAVLARQPIALAERANSPQHHPRFEEAMALYRDGMGSEAVGAIIGVSGATILFWAKRHGIKRSVQEAWAARLKAGNKWPFRPKKSGPGADS